jgi:hypothetical protein
MKKITGCTFLSLLIGEILRYIYIVQYIKMLMWDICLFGSCALAVCCPHLYRPAELA